MATTLTVLVCDGRRVALGHVGDSRAYLLRDGQLGQLSTDHTYVQQLVEAGRLSPEDRAHHPWRNVVLRSVDGDPEGSGLDIAASTSWSATGCCCAATGSPTSSTTTGSPGCWPADPHAAASVLTQLALAAGGRDNITCIVVDLVEGPPVVGDGRLLGAVRPGQRGRRGRCPAAATRPPDARLARLGS